MVKLRLIGSIAVGLLALTGVSPAQAASTAQTPQFDFAIKNLIVKYADGVDAHAADGQPTGENTAAADLVSGRDLGDGWHTVGIAGRLTADQTWQIAQRLQQDPRIASVDVDRILSVASASGAAAKSSQLALSRAYAAIKPASAVRSVLAVDDFKSTAPTTARIKLSWKAPATLGSAKLSGYMIQMKRGTAAWSTLKANTRSSVTSIAIASGLTAASTYSFRVAALTSASGVMKAGAYSPTVSAVPTTAPTAPMLAGSSTVTTKSPVVSWAKQTAEQQGAPGATYVATATAAGQADVSCVAGATDTSCSLAGLVDGASYKVAVVVKNKRGSAVSSAGFTPQDAYYAKQWYLSGDHGIHAPTAWARTLGSSSVVVAVLDTGITKHPDLDSQMVSGYDFVSSAASGRDGDGWDSDPTDMGDYSSAEPSSWHGTHVSGIIAAATNTIGVVGVAPGVRVQMVRVLGADSGAESDLIAGLKWAAGISVAGAPANPTPAKVINLSMGTDKPTPCRIGSSLSATEEALALVKAAGVTTITAAGNYNMPASYSYPGNCYPTLNVGATGFSGDRAAYSNYSVQDSSSGDFIGVDLSAPGGDSKDYIGTPEGSNGRIMSTWNDGKTTVGNPTYDYMEGTSMAAPVVSGVVALVYSIKPGISFDDMWTKVIQPSLTPFEASTKCAQTKVCGGGIVNAAGALAAASALP